MLEELNKRIREQRESLGLSVRELSRRTGISASFLYQIEKQNSAPTITLLKRIADALSTSVGHLIGEEQISQDVTLTRVNERKTLSNLGKGLTVQFLSTIDKRHKMEPTIQVLEEPDSVSGDPAYQHSGDEFCYVLEGAVCVAIGDRDYSLKEGDSIYFQANSPHSVRNLASGKSRLLFITSPPYF